MARYYGEVTGQAKTTASRLGSERSGLRAHIRGWSVGARVNCRPVGESDRDRVEVYATSGSGYGGARDTHVATFTETLTGIEVVLRHPKTGNVVARHLLKRDE